MVFGMFSFNSICFCFVVSRILCSSCVQDEVIENTVEKGQSDKAWSKITLFRLIWDVSCKSLFMLVAESSLPDRI